MGLFNIFKKKTTYLQPLSVTVKIPEADILKNILFKSKIRISETLFDVKSINVINDIIIININQGDYEPPFVPDVFFS